MDNFDLRKFLYHNPLLKENMDSHIESLNNEPILQQLIKTYGSPLLQYWVTSGEFSEDETLDSNDLEDESTPLGKLNNTPGIGEYFKDLYNKYGYVETIEYITNGRWSPSDRDWETRVSS